MKKRMLSILMALVLLFSMVPAQALTTLAAESGATISLGRNYRSVWVVVGDTPYQTDSSGNVVDSSGSAVLFAPGSYTVYYATQGGSSATGSGTVGASDTAISISMSSTRFSSATWENQMRLAKSIYYNASRFDHLDIRVAGSYVMEIGGTSYTATVSNPSAVVNVNGTQAYTGNWTGTTSYEWRKTNIRLNRTDFIEVILTLDLTYTGSDGKITTLEDVVVVYDNVNDLNAFVKAIAICDGVQGLDFTVDVEDIKEVIEDHIVTYQWMVYNEDGTYTELPEGAPIPPVDSSVYATGDDHTVDTLYAPGTSFADYDAGLLYTFHGWDTYSHSSEFNINPQAQGYDEPDTGTIEITNDTWVNGYWTVTALAVAEAYFQLAKVIQVDTDGDGDIDAATISGEDAIQFLLDTAGYDSDGDGSAQARIAYTQIKAAGGAVKVGIYDEAQYGKSFVFTETGADIPGYTRTTTVSLSGSVHTYDDGTTETTAALTWSAADPMKASVVLTSVFGDTAVNLGTLTYTNTYTKIVGEPVDVYPTLNILKTAADTNIDQAGAQFALYNAAGDTVGTYTTNANGVAAIDFTGFAPGTYTLKETAAPAGYYINDTVTTITLTAGTPVEQFIGGEYVQVTTYTATASAPEDSGVFTNTASRIHYYDQPILGSVAISKAFSGLTNTDDVTATVVFHGPVTRDNDGTITDLGQTYTVTLNKDNSFQYTLEDLSLGEYLVRETMATIHGYTWDGGTYAELSETEVYNNIEHRVLTVSEDASALTLSITNGYTQWDAAEFFIRKVSPTGTALGGAEFTLYSDAALTTVVSTQTTDSIGYARFGGFTVPEGDADSIIEYYLKETKAPNGYYLNDTVYRVQVKAVTANGATNYETRIQIQSGTNWVDTSEFDRTNDLLTVTDEPLTGSLVIKKIVQVTNYNEVLPLGLESITVLVTGPNFSQEVTLTPNEDPGKDFTATLTGLALGQYYIREVGGNVPGYSLTTTYAVDGVAMDNAVAVLAETETNRTRIGTQITAAVEITNRYQRNSEEYEIPTSIKVLKVDETGAPLAGAQFKLTRSDGYEVTFTTGANGTVVFDMLSGSIENGIPKDGTFTLEEIAAPDGYVRSEAKWTVTVCEDDGQLRIVLNADKNTFEGYWDWIAGLQNSSWDSDTLTLVVPNTREKNTLTVTKIAEHWLNDEKLANPEIDPQATYSFTLQILDATGAQYETKEFTLKAGASQSFSIPYGYSYTVTEHIPENALFVPEEQTVTGIMGLEDASVSMINRYFFIEENGILTASKIDAETEEPLEGAEYTLYTDEALTDVLATATSDANGSFRFELPLADATYYLVETAAPDGYHLSKSVYTVTGKVITKTDLSGDLPVTFSYLEITADLEQHAQLGPVTRNTAIKEVPISVKKVWVVAQDVTHPGSVDVVLFRNGEAFETVTLSDANNWSYSWTGLTDEYTWTVDEPAVPSPYYKQVTQQDGAYTITNYYSDIPRTGDFASLGLWLGMLALSSGGMIFTGLKLRKKEDGEA